MIQSSTMIKNWQKSVGYLLTPMFLCAFVGTLLIFHPIQMIARQISYRCHKAAVDLLNRSLVWVLLLVGTKLEIEPLPALPQNGPLIILSNHQSLYDPPLLHVIFAKYHPKYVAKKELSRWLPSVSYNLRHGGSVLIDRADKIASLKAILPFAEYINSNRYAAIIFPEGTRARDGKLKPFKSAGVQTMIKKMPDAKVIPVALKNSWQLQHFGLWPLPFAVNVKVKVFPALDPKESDAVDTAHQLIQSYLQQK